MQSLEAFPVPNDGEITLCQINGRMQCMSYGFANISTFTTSIDKHPKIHITRDTLHHTALSEEGRDLFLPTDVPFLKQLSQVYYEQGIKDVLHTAALHQHIVVSSTAILFLKLLRYVKKIQIVLNPSLQYHGTELINDLSQTRNWSNNIIRCIQWHPYSSRLAVVTSDDCVRVYSNDNNFVSLLKCKQQKNVTCVAWRPICLTEIAVGHETGIIIWNVDFQAMVARPSNSNTTILHRIEHQPVLSLEWSPMGNILASAAARDTNILIWDVELDRTSILKGSRDNGNILLKWSPAEDKLLSVSDGIVFKIWNCQNWSNDRWTVLSGHVQSACWSNCGSYVLFTTSTEPIIYSLIIQKDQIFTTNTDSSINHATPLFDLHKVEVQGSVIGGLVQSMEIDSTGHHLAVCFKDNNFIAIFSVVKVPLLQIVPSSLIAGLPAEVPCAMAFQQNFKNGACLTIGWSSGRVQHFPIVYTDLIENFN